MADSENQIRKVGLPDDCHALSMLRRDAPGSTELSALLQAPLRSELPAELEVFDVPSRERLDAWLHGVEASAPEGHIDLVQRVYGEAWLRPFQTMFETTTPAA
jgi:hypothetical protein